MNNNDLLKLMLDYKRGSLEKYSKDDARETIKEALIELNGGKTTLGIHSMGNRQLFQIVGEYVDTTVSEGLRTNEFFNEYVEQKNLAEGDGSEFYIEADKNFIVSDIARGNQALRRQRVAGTTTVSLSPTAHGVKVYDEMSRVLSGRIDIGELGDAVALAVQRTMLDDIFSKWDGLAAADIGGTDYYPAAGSYSETTLMTLISHVEAATESSVKLVTTLAGARLLTTAANPKQADNDYYNHGYALKFNGIDVFVTPQRHKVGTNAFALSDAKIYVIPTSMDRPVKQVIGGDSFIKVGEPGDNADMSIDLTHISFWATGIVAGSKFGVYQVT